MTHTYGITVCASLGINALNAAMNGMKAGAHNPTLTGGDSRPRAARLMRCYKLIGENMAKYDKDELKLTDRYKAALNELMAAELEMMREHEPDMADCWSWGICL